jgi:hypothetical protein
MVREQPEREDGEVRGGNDEDREPGPPDLDE